MLQTGSWTTATVSELHRPGVKELWMDPGVDGAWMQKAHLGLFKVVGMETLTSSIFEKQAQENLQSL